MLDFNNLFSDKRTGKEKNFEKGIRSEYQRDFDRLIFSSPFRRLQNKTQVFPLPGSSFVHNRLTHSLEVSTVGRSLGKLAGDHIAKNYCIGNEKAQELYRYELSNVIAAACLAHDIGNPAFGHSGESAISNYFTPKVIKKNLFADSEWSDLTNFEGNANALRILTHQFKGNLPGGQRLTYTTLATIIKYPCESTGSDKDFKHLKKYGFFQTEKSIFQDIMNEFFLIQQSSSPLRYYRHPFVYLLEAADDITYTIIDFEDAHRIGILAYEEIQKSFLALITCINRKEDKLEEINAKVSEIKNPNEKIAYLRSRAINSLILEANDIFINNIPLILNGEFNNTLIGVLRQGCEEFRNIEATSDDKIYNHPTVVEIELAGYNVMYELLNLMIPSVISKIKQRDKLKNKTIELIPQQYGLFTDDISPYEKCMGVIDFVSGMTDLYATELYRKIKGIEIGKHS
jgi:dGTPase